MISVHDQLYAELYYVAFMWSCDKQTTAKAGVSLSAFFFSLYSFFIILFFPLFSQIICVIKYVKWNCLSFLLLIFFPIILSCPSYFFLSFYLSLADLISQCNIINSLLFLLPCRASFWVSKSSRLPWLLNSRASPRPVSRLRRRTLHFFRHACRSRSSSFLPARRLIFPKSAALPLRHLLSLPPAGHRTPFPLPLDRPTQLLVSSFSSSSCASLLPNFAFPFSRSFCCDDKISVNQRETRRSHLGFFRRRRQTPYDESVICISKLEMA